MSEYEQGYQANLDGLPAHPEKSHAWLDGWLAADAIRQRWYDLLEAA
jgi:hypothetical protein